MTKEATLKIFIYLRSLAAPSSSSTCVPKRHIQKAAMGSPLRLHFSSQHVSKLLPVLRVLRTRLRRTVIHTATDSTIAVCNRRCTCMYPTSCVGGADRAGVDGGGSVPSAVLAGVVLILSVGSAHAARPWIVQFGGCVLSGDRDGAPLVRTGSCPTQGGYLDLSGRGITSVKSDSFADMGAW